MAEAGVFAVEAIGQAAKQNPAEMQQAMLVAGDVKQAQAFELGLQKASETSAANFQAIEETRRRAVETANRVQLAETTRIEVRPNSDKNSLGSGLTTYMESFQGRTAGYPSELESFIAKIGDSPKLSAAERPASSTDGATANDDSLNAKDALHILERSFQVAIETELVSNASKHSTQVFNDLMKGQ